MKKLFRDYLNIYTEFPANEYMTKEKRKQRYDALCRYGEYPYTEEITMVELQ